MLMLLLGLLVGIAVASEEAVWIGNMKPEIISVPNPIPMITELPHGDFNPDEDTLYYDERNPMTGWAYYSGRNGWGIKFIPPASNGTITSALVYLYNVPTRPNRFLVRVVDGDGPNGSPGTTLYETDTITGTLGAWNTVPLSVSFTNPAFYIFYIQARDSGPYLGIDRFDNAPTGVKWQYLAGVYSPEPDRFGEWLMRVVIDWTPQDNNFGTTIFANLPLDTLPNINLQMRGTVKNYGTQTAASGVPVKLRITGPQGYVYTDDQPTTVSLQRGQTQMITFVPNWHVPDTMGIYTIKIWHELTGDEYPANDTITRTLGIARWFTYANWQSSRIWIYWGGPERATKFHPPDFPQITYPFQIQSIRHQFYELLPNHPWADSSFRYKIYGDNGVTELYTSEILLANRPSSIIQDDVEPPVVINSGDFYVSVVPLNGADPNSVSDTLMQNHSFIGSAGAWNPWTYGEWFLSVAISLGVGIEENNNLPLARPKISVYNYPNPTSDIIRLEWQIPQKGDMRIDLFDVTGREVKTLYNNYAEAQGSLYIRTDDLSNGAYMIRLKNGKETATTKLILQK